MVCRQRRKRAAIVTRKDIAEGRDGDRDREDLTVFVVFVKVISAICFPAAACRIDLDGRLTGSNLVQRYARPFAMSSLIFKPRRDGRKTT